MFMVLEPGYMRFLRSRHSCCAQKGHHAHKIFGYSYALAMLIVTISAFEFVISPGDWGDSHRDAGQQWHGARLSKSRATQHSQCATYRIKHSKSITQALNVLAAGRSFESE